MFLSLYFWKRKRKGLFIIHFLFFIYCLSVISVTFFPIPIEDILEGVKGDNYPNFVPLASIWEILEDGRSYIIYRQILGNLILLLPLGFFVPLLSSQKLSWKKVLGIGFLVSAGIESLQLIISWKARFNYKIFDMDDLLLNVIGVMLGYGAFKIWKWAEMKWLSVRREA